MLIVSIALASFTSMAARDRYIKVNLTCTNPGSHQDVAKTPSITNNTNKAVPWNTTIYWQASDGDSGHIAGPLAIGASKQVLGAPGNAYSCTAYYWSKI